MPQRSNTSLVVGAPPSSGRAAASSSGSWSRDSRLLDAEPRQPRRAGLLAVLVRQHRRPKGCVHLQHDMVDLRGAVRQRRPWHHEQRTAASASRSCSSPTASATRCYFPLAVGATSILWPGPPTPAHVYATIERTGRRCSSRCRPVTACCWRTTPASRMSSGDRTDTGRRAPDRRPVVDPARGVGRRGAAAGALRALQAAIRHRHHRRHRLDRGPAHVHLEPARRDPPRIERPSRARLRRADRRRRTARRSQTARSAISGSGATRPARATGTSTRRPRRPSTATGCAPATSTLATPTATSGTRAAPTTC